MKSISTLFYLAGMANTIIAGTPKSYGVLFLPGFDALDAFGPLEYVNALPETSVAVISQTLDPVWSFTLNATMSTLVKTGAWHKPTHTFATAPPLDVLIVIGGVGSRAISTGVLSGYVNFISERYPSLRYLLSVCTGNALSAASGVLNGKRATGNKRSWAFVTGQGPLVNWVPKARWVVDSNIWTASGVESGTDMIYSFVKEIYSEKIADAIATTFEHAPHKDPSWDPFADIYNTTGTLIPPAPTPAPLPGYPTNFGVIAYPGVSSFELLGAIEFLWSITTSVPLNISIIAADLSPIKTNIDPMVPLQKHLGLPRLGQVLWPDHTFDNAPPLEVLIIPGAPRVPQNDAIVSFISQRYPSLRHLISIGTGSALVAKSGVINNAPATTNKRLYHKVKAGNPLVLWEPKGRWVVANAGKVWTSSGGAAVLDTMNGIVTELFGAAFGVHVCTNLEYVPNPDPNWDPFSV